MAFSCFIGMLGNGCTRAAWMQKVFCYCHLRIHQSDFVEQRHWLAVVKCSIHVRTIDTCPTRVHHPDFSFLFLQSKDAKRDRPFVKHWIAESHMVFMTRTYSESLFLHRPKDACVALSSLVTEAPLSAKSFSGRGRFQLFYYSPTTQKLLKALTCQRLCSAVRSVCPCDPFDGDVSESARVLDFVAVSVFAVGMTRRAIQAHPFGGDFSSDSARVLPTGNSSYSYSGY